MLTSRSEGGPGVVAEAVMASTPLLLTRIEGAVGMLGPEHPGLFEVGDAAGLAALLQRAERDATFLGQLTRAGELRRPAFERARELAAWRELLAELTDG